VSFIRIPKPWQLSENLVTPESVFLNRRRLIKGLVGAGIGAAIAPLAGCQKSQSSQATNGDLKNFDVPRNPEFSNLERSLTQEDLAAQYNNFYEFGSGKSVWRAAQALPTENWKVEVGGLVKNPRTYDMDDIAKRFPYEERVYRFRCVEAWAMVIPWTGFPMRLLLEDVEPTSEAKFVRFSSYYNPKITTGPGWRLGDPLPWPYSEGLSIEEMANDLAFFATGIYGHALPKQHGAPIRMVVPWKYGFKGAKSIVKIEFLAERPATFWNTIAPHEYGFEANVNPDKPHPRWSQAQERMIGPGPAFSWEVRETLHYNGYGEYVADLYA
jgi:sulfoxide reductase catalytic subunit YedY